MSVESDRLAAAQSLALVQVGGKLDTLTRSVDEMRGEIRSRATLPERAFVLAGKLQSAQALSLALAFAIVTVSLATAVPLFIGGMLLATQDPAAVLAFVADLFHLTRPGV